MKKAVILVCLALTVGFGILAYIQESRIETYKWSPRLASAMGQGEVVASFVLEWTNGGPPEIYTHGQGGLYRYVMPDWFRGRLKKIVTATRKSWSMLFKTPQGLALWSVEEGKLYPLPREVRRESVKV